MAAILLHGMSARRQRLFAPGSHRCSSFLSILNGLCIEWWAQLSLALGWAPLRRGYRRAAANACADRVMVANAKPCVRCTNR